MLINPTRKKDTSMNISYFEQVFYEFTKSQTVKSSSQEVGIDTWDNIVHSISGNNNLILAGGSGGNILRSTDSGLNWEEKSLGEDEYTSQSVFVVDEKNCFILSHRYSEGEASALFKSGDGGKRWRKISIPIENLNSLFMINERVGLATGMDCVARTENGGETWNIVEKFEEISFENIQFYDDKNGIIAGQYQGDEKPLRDCIITTIDAGLRWEIKIFNHNYDLAHCQHISKNCYYMLGNVHGLDTNLLFTSDNGDSFTKIIENHPNYLGAFQFFGEENGIAVGEEGTVLLTTDNGKHWTESSFEPKERCLNTLFVGADFIIVGGQGVLLRSEIVY